MNNGRVNKISIQWVVQPDQSRGIIFDKDTWSLLEEVAKHKGTDARHMISKAVAECLGKVMVDNYTLNRFLKKDDQ